MISVHKYVLVRFQLTMARALVDVARATCLCNQSILIPTESTLYMNFDDDTNTCHTRRLQIYRLGRVYQYGYTCRYDHWLWLLGVITKGWVDQFAVETLGSVVCRRRFRCCWCYWCFYSFYYYQFYWICNDQWLLLLDLKWPQCLLCCYNYTATVSYCARKILAKRPKLAGQLKPVW